MKTSYFIIIQVLIIVYLTESRPLTTSKLIEKWMLNSTGRELLLRWNFDLVNIAQKCEISHSVRGSDFADVEAGFKPSNYSVITGLLPHKIYEVHIVCYYKNQTQSHLMKKLQNFTVNTDTNTTVPQPTHHTLMSSTPVKHHILTSTTDTDPSVYKTKLTSQYSTTDIVLVTVFGLATLGVLITIGYYMFKKLRRRQRLRRFLQYRQHENEPFQQMQDEDDTPVL